MIINRSLSMYISAKDPEISSSCLLQLTENIDLQNRDISFFLDLDGNVSLHVQSRQYDMNPGDLIFCREETILRMEPAGSALVLAIQFNYIFFSENFGRDLPLLFCNSVEEPKEDYSELSSALAELVLAQISNTEENRFLIQHKTYSLFHLLKSNFIRRSPNPSSAGRQEQKIEQLRLFIENHCTEPLTLQEAADHMHYTPQYLSQFIRKNLGLTFNAWLNRERLSKSQIYLKHSSFAPFQVAAFCGFSNYSHYSRLFEETFHQTPELYREEFQKNFPENNFPSEVLCDSSTVRDILLNRIKPTDTLPRTIVPVIREEHCIDVEEQTPCQKNWNQLINLGDAKNFEKPRFRDHITQIQNAFHFQYGRFGNILQLVDIYYNEENPSDPSKRIYDFSRAFEAIDYMLELEMKPHLDFGGKPFEIYQPGNTHLTANISDILEYQESLFRPFLLACINRYGFDIVSSWHFEYWMYYSNNMNQIETPELYSFYFAKFYHTIKDVLPDAQVGAPGFNLFLPIETMTDTLRALQRRDITPDFVSLLFYPYEKPQNYNHLDEEEMEIIISDDPDLLHKKIQMVKVELSCLYPDPPEICLTEFSTVLTPVNYVNDSIYQGCFILKQFLDNRNCVPIMSYWLATDYSMQYPDSAELLFGGNGLLTKDGIRKTGFHAFSFLTKLGSQLISQGKNYIATCSPHGEIQIILYHYTHFSKRYCQDPLHYANMKHPDTAFEDEPSLSISLNLKNVMPGDYKITEYTLDEEHGSILNIWLKMNYSRHIGPSEIETLKSLSIPDMQISHAEITDTFHIVRTLRKNEAILLILHYMV